MFGWIKMGCGTVTVQGIIQENGVATSLQFYLRGVIEFSKTKKGDSK